MPESSRRRKKVTIRDVAKACGYSIYTVSSVLNNKGDISLATSEKVRRAAKELNYDLLGNVSAVRRMSTRSIGIVVPNPGCLHHGFYNRAISTFRAMATNRDYDCKLFTEEDLLRRLEPERTGGVSSIGCKGLLVFCPNQNFHQYIPPLLGSGVAVALVRRSTEAAPGLFEAVDDDCGEMRRLLDFLHDKRDCRRFAFFAQRDSVIRGQGGRSKAFWAFAGERLGSDDAIDVLGFGNDGQRIRPELVSFIRQARDEGKRTVVCCWTDAAAMVMMGELQKVGLSVPGDVLVTGYNNDPHSGQTYPGITTMNIPIEEMTAGACRYLFEYRDEGELPPYKRVAFAHEPIERESTRT